ncbi:MAG: cytochrome c3 family protein [Spirochaetota bacterium]|nr:cytochrome c3 family protein [Spirochaetota bacterium]
MNLSERWNIYFLLCTIALLSISCSEEKSGTDIVSISSVNAFVTISDIKKGIKKTTSRMTQVNLSHQVHEETGVPCITCHRKEKNDSRIKKCVYCHKGLQGATHLHKFCIKCHKEKNNGPISCVECHVEGNRKYLNEETKKEYSSNGVYNKNIRLLHEKAGVQCIVCHHNSSVTDSVDMKQEKKCSNCHTGESRMRIMHVFCKECHKRKDKGPILSKKNGPIDCDGCHKRKDNMISQK